MTWTDERLDDLSRRMDLGFERVDRDIRDLKRDVADLRTEFRTELRAEIGDLRSTMNRFGTGMIIALAGVIAAQLLGG